MAGRLTRASTSSVACSSANNKEAKLEREERGAKGWNINAAERRRTNYYSVKFIFNQFMDVCVCARAQSKASSAKNVIE
jgi:hypothetical protein